MADIKIINTSIWHIIIDHLIEMKFLIVLCCLALCILAKEDLIVIDENIEGGVGFINLQDLGVSCPHIPILMVFILYE